MNKRQRKKRINKLLLCKELPLNMSTRDLSDLFYVALQRKENDALLEIIKKHPEFDECEGVGLSNFIYNDYPEFLEEAFINGVEPDRKCSFLILVHDDPIFTKLGIKYGAKLEKTNESGEVALGYASAWGNLDVVKILVSSGANVNYIEGNSEDESKFTPLDSTRQPEIHGYLRSKGAKYYSEIVNDKVETEGGLNS